MEEKNLPAEKKKETGVLHDITKQAVDDIIIPKTKETANNMASDIIYMIGDTLVRIVGGLIFGKDKIPNNPKARGGNDREKYSNISRSTTSQPNIGTRSSEDLQYVCVDSYQKAEEIKRDLIGSITKYGRVRVADLYEASKKVKTAFPDYNYGWTNVNDVHYVRDRNGYWFNMPKPQKLNN